MALIEDYALIGDRRTAALVSRQGSIDWLCLPRFDSDAVFAALLGDESNGRWLLAPADEPTSSSRRYRDGSLVIDNEYETATGTVRVTDCMAAQGTGPTVVRVVEGLSGTVEMRMELTIRFGYGLTVPWVRTSDEGISAVAGPDALFLRTEAPLKGEDMRTVSDFEIGEGEVIPFTLTWHPSHLGQPDAIDGDWAVENTERRWAEWSTACAYDGRVAPAGGAFPDHAEGAVLRGDGGDLRGPDDLPPRGPRGRAQLGLPLLLAARRRAQHRRADARRLHRGGDGVRRLAPARHGLAPLAGPDPLRAGR